MKKSQFHSYAVHFKIFTGAENCRGVTALMFSARFKTKFEKMLYMHLSCYTQAFPYLCVSLFCADKLRWGYFSSVYTQLNHLFLAIMNNVNISMSLFRWIFFLE